MFNRYIEVTITTRFKNEDNFKIDRLASTYVKSGEPIMHHVIDNDKIKIGFTTRKGCVKQLKEHLNLLTFVGIKAEMEIK